MHRRLIVYRSWSVKEMDFEFVMASSIVHEVKMSSHVRIALKIQFIAMVVVDSAFHEINIAMEYSTVRMEGND